MNERAVHELLAIDGQPCLGRVQHDVRQLLRPARVLGAPGQDAGGSVARRMLDATRPTGAQSNPRGRQGADVRPFGRTQRAAELVVMRSTLRQGCSRAELLAHEILDRVAAGEALSLHTINRALASLGDC
jgi:hypothetical protein